MSAWQSCLSGCADGAEGFYQEGTILPVNDVQEVVKMTVRDTMEVDRA